MGQAKHLLMENEHKHQVAVKIAVSVGLLEICDHHDEILDSLENNHVDAYKLGNSLITNNDPLVAVFKGNRSELTGLIKDVTDEYGDECYVCCKFELE